MIAVFMNPFSMSKNPLESNLWIQNEIWLHFTLKNNKTIKFKHIIITHGILSRNYARYKPMWKLCIQPDIRYKKLRYLWCFVEPYTNHLASCLNSLSNSISNAYNEIYLVHFLNYHKILTSNWVVHIPNKNLKCKSAFLKSDQLPTKFLK